MIVRVRVLFFQGDARAIERGKGPRIWPNYIVPKGRFFEFYKPVEVRLSSKGAGTGLTWTRSKFRTESRRSVSFDTWTKPDTPVSWGASEMGGGTTLRTIGAAALRARFSGRNGAEGEKVMDCSKKGLTSNERVDSAIISRAEPSRAEPSRAEPSRAEPSRAEPSRAEPSRAEPSRAEPSRAEPSRAEPSRAEAMTAPRLREQRRPPSPPESSARPARTTRHYTPSVRPSEWPCPSAWMV